MAEKYIHVKGLERQQLRNYPRALQVKIRELLKGKAVSLSKEDSEVLDQFVKKENNLENKQPKKLIKENKDGK